MSFIEVNDLCKSYKIVQAEKGIKGAVKSLFHRKYQIREAVKHVSFQIEKGEIVGYIGPNGAGKSTTIKMLSGVLIPSSGTVSVGGIVPYEKRKENARHIGVVFGQRSQLYWDLPLSDTFDLYENLYEIPKDKFRQNCDFFIDLLDMGEFVNQPVRQLSLGQKMKANIAISLLHDPDVLYLDEPTIGLDVTSKKVLRDAIRKINQEKKTTIMLTTHDMDDIEAVSQRLILIDQGQKLFDGTMADFRGAYGQGFSLKLEFDDAPPPWQDDPSYALENTDGRTWVVKAQAGANAKDSMIEMIRRYNPQNLYVQEARIEDIVREVFSNRGA